MEERTLEGRVGFHYLEIKFKQDKFVKPNGLCSPEKLTEARVKCFNQKVLCDILPCYLTYLNIFIQLYSASQKL